MYSFTSIGELLLCIVYLSGIKLHKGGIVITSSLEDMPRLLQNHECHLSSKFKVVGGGGGGGAEIVYAQQCHAHFRNSLVLASSYSLIKSQ